MSWNDDIAFLEKLWDEVLPDPVDVFEDDLAEKLGITRHPELPYQDWRRLRVAAIEAVEEQEGGGV